MLKMINYTFLLIWIMLCVQSNALEIDLVYPAVGDTIFVADFDSNAIFGRVLPPYAQLTINGHKTDVQPNGSFLSFLPMEPGLFTYTCQAVLGVDTLVLKRTVLYTAPSPYISPDSTEIDSSSTRPSGDLVLQPGDIVDLEFRGTPHCSAWCRIDGVEQTIPLLAVGRRNRTYWGTAVFGQGNSLSPVLDSTLYRGSYVLQAGDSCDHAEIRFYLAGSRGDTVSNVAPGTISTLHSGVRRMARTAVDLTVLRTGPRKSYYYFLPQGVKLWLSGKIGRSWRVQLAKNHSAWIEDYKVHLLPEGSTRPRPFIRLVRTENYEDKMTVRVYTGERLPFRIEQTTSPQALTVYFYGLTADTDWIRHDWRGSIIGEIRWQQVSDDVYALTVNLNQKNQWGYNADYDEKGNFVLDINKAPRVGKRRRSALRNMTILIDPGHDPDTGAVGPTRFEEREANLLLAAVLADKLRKKGARIIMTREEQEGLALGDRMRFAMHSGADILLSLHHNAVPAGVNPLKNHGSSTYYYHPQSYELAKRIQQELLSALKLNDFGLYWDNLAMCRPTQMPAVLIEPAFMMHPAEEQLVRSQEYREKCASAIIRALQSFALEFGNK